MSVAFRATMLWNEVILDFQLNMKRRRHRYNLRFFDSTFTGKEATKFLLKRLRQNELFGPDINSKKVKLLLSKLLSAGVFVNVIRSTPYFRSKGLYRFPEKMPLTPLTLSAQDERSGRSEPNRGSENPVRLTLEQENIRDKMMLLYNQKIVHVDDTLHWQTTVKDCGLNNGDGCKKIYYADYCQRLMEDLDRNKEIWRNKVINRIRDIMGVNAERFLTLLMHKATIWPSMNACLLVRTHKMRTKFPLVDECLRALGFYGLGNWTDRDMYACYPRDIAQCLGNILVERYGIMSIFSEMSLTMIYFYCFLNELDGERKEEDDARLMRFSADEAMFNSMEYKPLRPTVPCDDTCESDDTISNASSEYFPEEDLDEAIEAAQKYLWKLTTPTREIRGARPPQLCLETAFSCESPVTRVVCRREAQAQQEGCADTYRKHWRCTPHRCLYEKNNEEHVKIQNLLKAIIVMTRDSQPDSADTLHKSMALFASICHRKTAKFWLDEVKVFAIHLYRLVFLFLTPEDYNMLAAALFVLNELKKDKKQNDELYEDIYWVVFGRTNDGHAFRDIMEFFIENWRELFKPFEIEQILTQESVSFLKENKYEPTHAPKPRPKAARKLRIPLAETHTNVEPELKSLFASNFAVKSPLETSEMWMYSYVAEDYPYHSQSQSEPDPTTAFMSLKMQVKDYRVDKKAVPLPPPPPKPEEKKEEVEKKPATAAPAENSATSDTTVADTAEIAASTVTTVATTAVKAANVSATGAIPKCKNAATNTDENARNVQNLPGPVLIQKSAERPVRNQKSARKQKSAEKPARNQKTAETPARNQKSAEKSARNQKSAEKPARNQKSVEKSVRTPKSAEKPVGNQKSAEKQKPSSCVRITKEVFKKQVITNSQKALEDLLDQIINDKNMSEKERNRRLKKFSEEYPHIFEKRFTTKPTKKGHSMRF